MRREVSTLLTELGTETKELTDVKESNQILVNALVDLRKEIGHESTAVKELKLSNKYLQTRYEQLQAEEHNFNQHSENDVVKAKPKHVDTVFVQQNTVGVNYTEGSFSQFSGKTEYFTVGGLGRRRMVGAEAPYAWDFLVTTFFEQPSGGQAGYRVGAMGGKRGIPKLSALDVHDNQAINLWKQVLYWWIHQNFQVGDWRQAEGRKHWNEFLKYVQSGGNPNVHGDPPKGTSKLLQAYMYMVAAGYHRSQFILEKSKNVTNSTTAEEFAAQVQGGREQAEAEGSALSSSVGTLSTAKSKTKTRSISISSVGRLRDVDTINYKEPGTHAGLLTTDLEFANTQQEMEFDRGRSQSADLGENYEVALIP